MHNSGRRLVCLFVSEFSSWSPLRQWPIFCSNAPSKGNEVECHRVPLTIFRSPDRFQRKSMLSSWPGRDNAVLLLSTVALAGGFNKTFGHPGHVYDEESSLRMLSVIILDLKKPQS